MKHNSRVCFLVVAINMSVGCDDNPVQPNVFFDSTVIPAPDGGRVRDVGEGACVQAEALRCDGSALQQCGADGRWKLKETCFSEGHCRLEGCLDPCNPQVLPQSNLGCEFWAVDLDNEEEHYQGTAIQAASSQIALTVANPQSLEVIVEVFQNGAAFGLPLAEQRVANEVIPPGAAGRIYLPQREVDGSMGQNGTFAANSGSGTFVSSHAYRVHATAPVAVYQHNPVVDKASNDGSLLLPSHVLGAEYLVLGWTTANPRPIPSVPMPSIPDRSAVTVVGLSPATQVTIGLTHGILASSGSSGFAIAQTAAGGQLTVTLGPYDVLNLESFTDAGTGAGDFSGTSIKASAPVVVFSNLERASAFGGAVPPPPPPGEVDACCTEHIEEQLWPLPLLGDHFAVGRSPVRSGGSAHIEPDLYRVLAAQNGTKVTTSLDPPFDTFALDRGEYASFYAYNGFVVQAAVGPVSISQHLVPMGLTGALPPLGDPSMTLVPAVDHYQLETILSVPETFALNYLVIVSPSGARVTLDGVSVGSGIAGCLAAQVGAIGTKTYAQLTCPVTSGAHEVVATEPSGVTVFGYGKGGAFSYPAGVSFDLFKR